MRAVWSADPPAAKGTIRRSGRVGVQAAVVLSAARRLRETKARPAMPTNRRRRWVMCAGIVLLHADVRGPNDLTPFGGLLAQEGGEFVRCATDRIAALLEQSAAGLSVIERGDQGLL